eukprot:scaffold2238_cov396-Prasinococcus_capsulatus_cf.AAC.4
MDTLTTTLRAAGRNVVDELVCCSTRRMVLRTSWASSTASSLDKYAFASGDPCIVHVLVLERKAASFPCKVRRLVLSIRHRKRARSWAPSVLSIL